LSIWNGVNNIRVNGNDNITASFFLLSRAWLFLAAGQGCLATLAARRVHVRGLLAA